MKNWLDQNIEIGDIVYRGARNGNSSSYRVGKVIALLPDKEKVRVDWYMDKWIGMKVSPSTCSIDSVVLISLEESDILTLRERRFREYVSRMRQHHPNYDPDPWF